MTITMQTTAQHTSARSRARSRRRRARAAAVGGAVLATGALYLAGRAAGTDFMLTDPGTGESAPLTLVQAGGFAMQIGLAGWIVLALLERFTRRAKAIWTTLAVVVLALSFVPVWYMQATALTRVFLVIMHVAVAAALLPMPRSARP
jgi:hypothetical protein